MKKVFYFMLCAIMAATMISCGGKSSSSSSPTYSSSSPTYPRSGYGSLGSKLSVAHEIEYYSESELERMFDMIMSLGKEV